MDGTDPAWDSVQELERLESRRRIGVWIMYGALAFPGVFFLLQIVFLVVYLFQGYKLPLPFGTNWTLPALLGGVALIGMLLVMPFGAIVRGIFSRKLSKWVWTDANPLPALRAGESLAWTRVLTASDAELHLVRPRFIVPMGMMKLVGAALCTAFAGWIAYQLVAGNAPGRTGFGLVMIGAMLVTAFRLLSPVCLQWVASNQSSALTAEVVRLCFFRTAVEIESHNILDFELRSGILRVYGRRADLEQEESSARSQRVPTAVVPLLRAGRGRIGEVRSQRVIQSLLRVFPATEEFLFRSVEHGQMIDQRISAAGVVTSITSPERVAITPRPQ